MAKRPAATKSRADRNTEAIGQCLKRASVMLSRDGWNPSDRDRSIFGALTRASRELWPQDEATRLSVLAFSLAEVTTRIRRRYTHADVDAWEHEMYREPEEVVAVVASPVWPWSTMNALSPQETTIEAFMVLQRLNTKGLPIADLKERARAAFPASWVPDADTIDHMAAMVDERT